MKNERYGWLLFPIMFGISFFVMTMIGVSLWNPNRFNTYWFIYYLGYSIVLTAGPWLVSFICCMIGYAPHYSEIIIMSIIVSAGTMVVWILGDKYNLNLVWFELMIMIISAIVIGYYYYRLFIQIRDNNAA